MRWSFAPASTFRASIVVVTLAQVLAGCASAGAPKAMEPGAAASLPWPVRPTASRLGQGTRFEFTFPLLTVARAA